MADTPVGPGRPRRLAITRWALWSLPPAAIVFVIAGVLAALAAALTWHSPVGSRELGLAALLAAVCVLQHEAAIGSENARRRATATAPPAETAFLLATSVYTMAAALLLPPLLVAAVVVSTYIYRFVRIDRRVLPHASGPGYRTSFNGAAIVIAATAVHLVNRATELDLRAGMTTVTPLVLLGAAILTYAVVQFTIMAGAISLSVRSAAPAWAMATAAGQHGFQLTQLGIGALVACLLASPSPWSTVLVTPILWLLTRAVLVSRLEAEAAADSATGLLNAGAWHRRATSELQRARRRGTGVGVLVIDLDAFRTINHRFGSRVGDRALAHAAQALPAAVRDSAAAVGRMHGEEFAVVAPAADPTDVAELAQRVSDAIRDVDLSDVIDMPADQVPRLTASVGGSSWPADADSVDSLLATADTALRRAKEGGPGNVCLASQAGTRHPTP